MFFKNICYRLEIKSEKLFLKHVMMEECLSYLACVFERSTSLASLTKGPQRLCLCLNSLPQPLGVKDDTLPSFADEEIEMWAH